MRTLTDLVRCAAFAIFIASTMTVAVATTTATEVSANPCPNNRCR